MIVKLNQEFKAIRYHDDVHGYENTKLNKQLIPTTTYKKQWEYPFDLEYWSKEKAKLWGVEQDYVKNYWKWISDVSLSKGSYLHQYLEDLGNRKKFNREKPIYTTGEEVNKIHSICEKYYSEFDGAYYSP